MKEDAETCTPTFETVCEDVIIPVKNIVDKEQVTISLFAFRRKS